VSNFQWVWRYSCLNITHKKPYKSYERKKNDILIAFIGYVNDINKLQHFRASVQPPPPPLTSAHFSTLLAIVRTCSSPEVVLAFSLYEGSTFHNASDQFVSCVHFFLVDFAFHPSPQTKIIRRRQLQTAVFSHPLKIGHMLT